MMKTLILKSTAININNASKLIIQGELVVFPTETVYGLGADALNKKAVSKIFKANNRLEDNPLIVHIGKKSDLWKYGINIPESAKLLVKAF